MVGDNDTRIDESVVSDEKPGLVGFGETLAGGQQSAVGRADTVLGSDEFVSGPDETGEREAMPEHIGKYRVLHRLGEGGMGTVFAAVDAELDRKVAIKLVKTRLRGSGESAKVRLIREAKALAKISHPNVIRVYEVGAWRNRIFVAMELVDGWTLGRFQYRNITAWEDLLKIYKAAGRGLAAAHAGGLVHRDFKPDNVLVTRRGVPRVIDFGLARTIGAGGLEDEAAERPHLDLNEEIQLTRTGVVLGTPAYMAPEQHKGEATDARTDQFSFCVALYEALYAQRPFAGSTFVELTANVLAGTIEEPPPFIRVPGWIRRVLKRGLSVDPQLRYPDMETLLRALEHDPGRRWRIIGGVLAVTTTLAVAALSWRAVDHYQTRRTETERLREGFDAQRFEQREAQAILSQVRTRAQRQNDFVVAAAQERLWDDPGAALAMLEHLDPEDSSVLPAARALADDALARGVVVSDQKLGGHVRDIAFSHSGRHVAVADASGTVSLIQTTTGRVELTMQVEGPVVQLVFTAEDAQLLVGDHDGKLYMFASARLRLDEAGRSGEADELSADWVRRAHDGPITTLVAAPTDARVAVGGHDGTVTVWQAETGELDRRLLSHEAAITALTFDDEGKVLYTADRSGKLYARDLDERSKRMLADDQILDGLAFQPGLVIGWDKGQLWFWTPKSATKRKRRGEASAHVAVVDDALVLVDARGTLRVEVGVHTQEVVEGLGAWTGVFGVSPTRKHFASGDERGRFVLRRLGDASGLRRFGDDKRPLVAYALGHTGARVALGNWTGQVSIDELDGSESRRLEGSLDGGTQALVFSPGDQHLLGVYQRERRLWEVASGTVIDVPDGRCEMSGVSWSGDGSRVAIAQCELDGLVEVFSISGEHESWWSRPGVEAVQLNASGRALLGIGGSQALVGHFDVGSGLAEDLTEAELGGENMALVGVAFVEGEQGGVRLVTHEDGRLRAWHWNPGEGQLYPIGEEAIARAPWTSPDRRFLLLPIEDGLLRFWDLERDHFVVVAGVGHAIAQPFEVSGDRQALLLSVLGLTGSASTQVHLASGAMRHVGGSTVFDAIGSEGGVLARRVGSLVETWQSPSPSEMKAFLAWVGAQSPRNVAASELLASPESGP